jgi:hypothetical protein
MFLVNFKIIHTLEIDEQLILNMTMGTGPIESGAIGNIGDLITVADLDDFLDLLCRPGQDYGTRYFGHHPLIPQTALIASRSAPIALANRRII